MLYLSYKPLGFAGSRNWYVYAGNDGVNYVDLMGLKFFLIDRNFWNEVGNNTIEALKYMYDNIHTNMWSSNNLEAPELNTLNLVCPKKEDDPCEGRITPEDVINWSKRVPEEEKGKHKEYRGSGGNIGVRLDFYLLTEMYIQDLNMALTGKACDDSHVNYHRASNKDTPRVPTIQIIRNGKTKFKIRYQ